LTYFTHQHSFVVFIGAFFLVFYWCSLGFQIGISPVVLFFTSMQVWKFKLIS
jgi:hypothetical protein